MLRWLTIIVSTALIVAVVLVARYDKLHDTEGKGYNIKCTQPDDPAATMNNLVCTAEHSQKAESGEYDPMWWHVFFAWPEGITALLLLLTLVAISSQTYYTRRAAEASLKSAKATEDNVSAFVSSQGPQIWLTGHGNPTKDVLDSTSRVQMEMFNKGPTTADDVTYEVWTEVLPSENDDFTPNASYWRCPYPMSVYPSQSPVILNCPLNRPLGEDEKTQIRKLQRRVCIRIKVMYRDIFTADDRYANFGYWVGPDGLGFLPRYNDRGTGKDKKSQNPN